MKSDIVPPSTADPRVHPPSLFDSADLPQTKVDRFGEVVSFVKRQSELLVLSDDHTGASIAVWPAMQGRVLTNSVEGPEGLSYGWINRQLIASGKCLKHVNAVGGEDRIWIGPEGGQFSIFFAPGVPFDLEHWYTPSPIDIEPFDIVARNNASVSFRRAFRLTNYSGTGFDVQIERVVRLLSSEQIQADLGINVESGLKAVGFESENELTNLAEMGWNEDSGLLSIWILGQFQATPQSTIILPYRAGANAALGVPITTDYFGPIPGDRIAIGKHAALFKADSNHRGKLGLRPQRATGTLGSYDGLNRVLTIVRHSQGNGFEKYVNSAWKIQEDPYQGDVINCYNDGPPSPGEAKLGSFYELESSSPARELNSNESVNHTHRTFHLQGTELQLDAICKKWLHTHLEDVRSFQR